MLHQVGVSFDLGKHSGVIECFNGFNCAFVSSRNGDGHLALVVVFKCSVSLSDTMFCSEMFNGHTLPL